MTNVVVLLHREGVGVCMHVCQQKSCHYLRRCSEKKKKKVCQLLLEDKSCKCAYFLFDPAQVVCSLCHTCRMFGFLIQRWNKVWKFQTSYSNLFLFNFISSSGPVCWPVCPCSYITESMHQKYNIAAKALVSI